MIMMMITETRDRVNITNNDANSVSFLKQKLQYQRDRLARMLRNKVPTIETDPDMLEQYPSFTADINIDETDKNLKHKEVFERLIKSITSR